MGQALQAIPIVGPIIGGLTGSAQQSQAQGQANKYNDAAAGALTQNEAFISSLLNGFNSGTGPLSTLFNSAQSFGNQVAGIGQGLTNANVFPSAGTSAMNTLLSRVGSIANPGAVIQNTSAQIGQEGIAGQIGAKQAGANLIGEGGQLALGGMGGVLSAISNLLTGATGGANSFANLGSNYQTTANNLSGSLGQGITGAIGAAAANPSIAAKLGMA